MLVFHYVHGWSQQTRKRADKDHARKKLARAQKQHLRAIKTPEQLQQIRRASRVKQKKGGC